jgi:flagellar basal body-associated protein FliL
VVVEPFERIMLKPGGNMTSVTLAVSLELVLPGMRQEIEANMASIRTIIETITGETNWSDLRSPEGKLALKLKLIKKINQSLAGQSLARAGIRDLFFTNLIMQ